MVRAPCCEKMGLKKGPWTPEEDHTLISYIQRHGHGNWRALPKQAGLLRCGKSCRLRWINYLRPDIKRGNFSFEEEETIIKLHELLGNRWSAIAARLPGRTDNEIKNVWHTHLKKRLVKKSSDNVVIQEAIKRHPDETTSFEINDSNIIEGEPVSSPPQSSSISNSNSDNEANNDQNGSTKSESPENFSEMDESFWMEIFPSNDSISSRANYSDCSSISADPDIQFRLQQESSDDANNHNDDVLDLFHGFSSNLYDDNDMNFWYDIFTKGGDLPELLAQM